MLYHINCQLNFKVFETLNIALIIKGAKKFYLKQKITQLPIAKDIVEKIIKNKPVNVDELNIDIAFNVA